MGRNDIDREALISRLRGLFSDEDTTSFNPLDLIYRFGSPLTALLNSELFWPQFVVFEEMVFLEGELENDDDQGRIRVTLARYGGNKEWVEKSFNFIEIPSLFGRKAEESTDSEDQLLAERMVAMWRARLADQFPDRTFEVTIVERGESDDEVGFLFYQVRDWS